MEDERKNRRKRPLHLLRHVLVKDGNQSCEDEETCLDQP